MQLLPTKFLSLLLILLLAGCGQNGSQPANSVQTVTPPIDVAQAATIKGVVRFEGAVPKARKLRISGNPECSMLAHGDLFSEDLLAENGLLQNAIVYIKEGLEGYQFPIPKESVLLDQKGCMFIPHVIAIQKYQQIELLNSDPTLHNVNARAKNSRGFNIGFPSKGMRRMSTLKESEVAVPIRCDLHPWMKGYIGVFDHPYFAVTQADGSFSFSPLPAGKYVVEVWHEKLGAQSQVLEVQPQETQEADFVFQLQP